GGRAAQTRTPGPGGGADSVRNSVELDQPHTPSLSRPAHSFPPVTAHRQYHQCRCRLREPVYAGGHAGIDPIRSACIATPYRASNCNSWPLSAYTLSIRLKNCAARLVRQAEESAEEGQSPPDELSAKRDSPAHEVVPPALCRSASLGCHYRSDSRCGMHHRSAPPR